MNKCLPIPLPVAEGTLRRVLEWLHATGFELVLTQAPAGSVTLDPPAVLAYLHNPEAFLADVAGVSLPDYRGWKKAEGSIQCHARTRGGRGPRCRNMVAEAGHCLTPREWASLQATHPTCWLHGGGTW